MDNCIDILKGIKKDELDERKFYEQVLTAIASLEHQSLNPFFVYELKSTLQEIGCVKYEDWKKEKEANGEVVVERNIGEGIAQADIGTAVSFVSQLLGDYSNARFSLPYMLDGGEKYGWVQTWLRNSAEISNDKSEEKVHEDFSEKIKGLGEIKKDELDERTFYEEVLKVVVGLEKMDLTPENSQQLKDALESIGCVDYEKWKSEKEGNGETVIDRKIGEGMALADIGTAVSFVSQLLVDHENTSFSLPYMLDGGEQYGWVQTWLRNSAEKDRKENPRNQTGVTFDNRPEDFSEKIKGLGEIKKDELDERTFYEEVLKVVVGLEKIDLTPENSQQLKDALESIGCVDYEKWKSEKEANGEVVVERNTGEGIAQADIGTAVNFVSQLLGDYSNASFSLPYMLDGGEQHGWVQTWLRNSAELKEKEAAILAEKKALPSIKAKIVEAAKDRLITKGDIIASGKKVFDLLIPKGMTNDKDENDKNGKDEI